MRIRMRNSIKTNKMKSTDNKYSWNGSQSEKPSHYMYLKDFRVEQCAQFLQHKCNQHRPFTCFHWHFLNQRRRRPIKKRDGTFNYSPDVYCTKFDETTGICADGDECPYLHRTAGDTERRYHLRFYKTVMCVHETDSRGICVKNGPHCAFAHGDNDTRSPVYDKDSQILDMNDLDTTNGANSLDKERNTVNDDPKWQDTSYVLGNYKTELCKRPPRLCRQGFSCPHYHNSKDRRRPPRKYKYRSTACPNVKHGDEWGEPANCDNGDSCQYCHTRTEQQFHPEIYKSTKCNDIQQNGYCPRGAFCAFAHIEQEMAQVRESVANDNCTGVNLADILQSALPPDNPPSTSSSTSVASTNSSSVIDSVESNIRNHVLDNGFKVNGSNNLPPIGSKPRHLSGNNLSYQKAPGSEREDRERKLADADKDKGKGGRQGLLNSSTTCGSSLQCTLTSSTVSPLAVPFFPNSNTFESVVGNALNDLVLDEPLNVAASFDKDFDSDSGPLKTSLSGFSTSGLIGSSAPVNIPGASYHDRNGSSFAANASSNTSSPAFGGSLLHSSFPSSLEANLFMRTTSANHGSSIGGSGVFSDSTNIFSLANMSPHNGHSSLNNVLSHSPLLNSITSSEVQRLRDELVSNRAKIASWEEGMTQARNACKAWKKEVDDAQRKYKQAEQTKDELISKLSGQQKEIEELRTGRLGPYVQALYPRLELESLPLHTLNALQSQLKQDLELVEKVINNYGLKNDHWPGVVSTW